MKKPLIYISRCRWRCPQCAIARQKWALKSLAEHRRYAES